MEPICALLAYCIVCTLIVGWLYWHGTRAARRLQATFPAIQGPKPWPFLGNLPHFLKVKGQFHLHFDSYCKTFGRLFSMSFFGSPALIISDPEMLRDVLVKNFDCFRDPPVSICCLFFMIFSFCGGVTFSVALRDILSRAKRDTHQNIDRTFHIN